MKIDNLISYVWPLSRDAFTLTEENLQKRVRKFFFLSQKSNDLYVMLPSWGFHHAEQYGKKIAKLGHSFLGYEFPVGILNTNAHDTRRYFEMLRDRAVDDIRKLREKYHFINVHLIGISLGCVHASMVSSIYPEFKTVTLVTPGHCLADSLWYGIRTQHLKKEYERKGVTLSQLKDEWKVLAPEHSTTGVTNARVKVYLSYSDTVIPYRFGKRLVEVMQNRGLRPEVVENAHLGHYGTAITYYMKDYRTDIHPV